MKSLIIIVICIIIISYLFCQYFNGKIDKQYKTIYDERKFMRFVNEDPYRKLYAQQYLD